MTLTDRRIPHRGTGHTWIEIRIGAWHVADRLTAVETPCTLTEFARGFSGVRLRYLVWAVAVAIDMAGIQSRAVRTCMGFLARADLAREGDPVSPDGVVSPARQLLLQMSADPRGLRQFIGAAVADLAEVDWWPR